MKKTVLVLAMLMSAACSQGGGSGPTNAGSCGSKPLLSTWHSNPGNIPFDFSNVQLGQATSLTLFFQSHTCQYDLAMMGSECSGSIVINNPVLLNGSG